MHAPNELLGLQCVSSAESARMNESIAQRLSVAYVRPFWNPLEESQLSHFHLTDPPHESVLTSRSSKYNVGNPQQLQN